MESEAAYKPKKRFGIPIPKRAIIVAICIIVLVAIGATIVLKANPFSKTTTVTQRTARVSKQDLTIKVTGSGPVESAERVEVTTNATSKIKKVYFKEGDSVNEGDLLFELDDSDAQLAVKKLQNSIAQKKMSVESDKQNVASLTVKAPFSGTVTGINLKAGDELPNGANILTITDYSNLKLTVPFSGALINDLAIGKKVTVNVQEVMQSVDGIIAYVGKSPYTTSSGGAVYNVEIDIKNPGSLTSGMTANAEINTASGSQTSTESSKLEYINYKVITSNKGGTVKKVNVKENQLVNAGDTLVVLENDELVATSLNTDIAYQDLLEQLKTAQEDLEDYKIYAPISGIIVSQDVQAGDNTQAGKVLNIIADDKNMKMSINVDELDIAKIKVGQKASITVDALEETTTTPLEGEVSQIALEGTSSSGVTTYPVTVKIKSNSALKTGMNANADIIISEVTDALAVPLEAVQTIGGKSFVMIKGSGNGAANANGFYPRQGGFAQGRNSAQSGNSNQSDKTSLNQNIRSGQSGNNRQSWGNNSAGGSNSSGTRSKTSRVISNNSAYYANAIMTPVEVGINTDEYIEIISGLKEGDEVILPPQSASSAKTTATTQYGMGGMVNMGGGEPPDGGGRFRD